MTVIFGMGLGLVLSVLFIYLIERGVFSFLWGKLQRCNPFYWRSRAQQYARELQLSIAHEDRLREQREQLSSVYANANFLILELQEEAKVKDERIARQTIAEHGWRETDRGRQDLVGYLRGRIEEMLVKLADKDESIRKLGVFIESREHVIDSLRRHTNSSVVEPKLVVPKKTKKKKS